MRRLFSGVWAGVASGFMIGAMLWDLERVPTSGPWDMAGTVLLGSICMGVLGLALWLVHGSRNVRGKMSAIAATYLWSIGLILSFIEAHGAATILIFSAILATAALYVQAVWSSSHDLKSWLRTKLED